MSAIWQHLRPQQPRRRWCRCAPSPTLRIVLGPQVDQPLQQLPLGDRSTARPAPGVSSGDALAAMDADFGAARCRRAMASNGPARPIRRSRRPGRPASILALAVLFAYLFLVALYESWMIPMPVLLSVAVGVLGAFVGAAGSRDCRSTSTRRSAWWC